LISGILTSDAVKPLSFLGTSLDELRAFPETARREAGHQLDQVQRGLEPDDWKPMPSVGPGVREVRIRDQAGAFRVIYTATRPEAVYVLHAFQKKTQATAKRDLDLAEARFRDLIRSKP
jgi:phage-related protein